MVDLIRKYQATMHNVAILSYNNTAVFDLGYATELFALPAMNLSIGIILRLLPLTQDYIAVLAALVSKPNRSII